jgi:hypothetical protein
VVSVLDTGPQVGRFKSNSGRWIFKAIKIRSTPSFGGEVSSLPHVVRLYGMLNNPSKHKEINRKAKFIISFASSSCFDTT